MTDGKIASDNLEKASIAESRTVKCLFLAFG